MSPLTESVRLTLAKGQPVPNDPSFAFNSLLLHGNGTNGSTVITDSSGSPKTVTAAGNAQISTAQSKFGGASIAFDGNGDYLSIPSSTGLLNFGSNDFTIEFWLYANSLGAVRNIIGNYATSTAANGLVIQLETNNSIGFHLYNFNSGNIASVTQGTLTANTWTHIAAVRTSTTQRLYINGTSTVSNALTTGNRVNQSTNEIRIGAEGNGFYWNGYIDDLRITNGVARYTSNFTPPTAPFPDF